MEHRLVDFPPSNQGPICNESTQMTTAARIHPAYSEMDRADVSRAAWPRNNDLGGSGIGGLLLVLSVSASWVCVAQSARSAEMLTGQIQRGSSVVPLMTCANCSAWMALAIPHILRRRRELGSTHDGRLRSLLETSAFASWQPPRFLAIAVATNFSYVAALHYLPASLNTALFCTSAIFTLVFSSIWLPRDPVDWDSTSLFAGRATSVYLSVIGIVLIAEPWHASSNTGAGNGNEISLADRLAGACLSIAAAVGTSVYQVYFKATFGSSLKPDEVGLFLARMGAYAFVVLGSFCVLMLATGVYQLDLTLVPWGHVALTAASSTVFNFLIKFGISSDSPLAMSLATQIGIPLNLLLDVVVVHDQIRAAQAAGIAAMLTSFSLQQQRRLISNKATLERDDLSNRLLN